MKTVFIRFGIVGMCVISVLASVDKTVARLGEVYAFSTSLGGVAVQPDGRFVVSGCGGIFAMDTASGIISLTRGKAFRFHEDASLDRSFHCIGEPSNMSNPMAAHVTIASDGRIFLTGLFSSIDGKPRNGYAMLLPDGKLDESFEPWRGQTNAPGRCGRGGALYDAALLTNGCVAVPSFSVACHPFNYLTTYLLDSSGAFLSRPGIDIITNDWPYARMNLLFRNEGFGVGRSIDWEQTNSTSWVAWPQGYRGVVFPAWSNSPSGADIAVELASLFKEAPIELCRYAVRLPDGGAILAVETTNGSSLMRFDSAWLPDLSFKNTFKTDINSYLAMIHQPDGKLLLTGKISKLNNENFPGIARLLSDGSTDPSFHCVLGGDTRVMGMALQKDGRILIVGFFTEVNGEKCPYLARLNPDGSLDTDFQRRFTTHNDLKARRRVPVQMLASESQTTTTAFATNLSASSVSQTVIITSLNLNEGAAMIRFVGNASQTYLLQFSDSLNASVWTSIATNKTAFDGGGFFRDESAKNSSERYYRVASPQQ